MSRGTRKSLTKSFTILFKGQNLIQTDTDEEESRVMLNTEQPPYMTIPPSIVNTCKFARETREALRLALRK